MNKRARGNRHTLFRSAIGRSLPLVAFVCLLSSGHAARAQNQFEKRPISNISVSLGGTQTDTASVEEYRLIAREAVGDIYSAPRVRDAIEALYNTKRVDTITVS